MAQRGFLESCQTLVQSGSDRWQLSGSPSAAELGGHPCRSDCPPSGCKRQSMFHR